MTHGWHYESHRHSLAARGVKTGRKSKKNLYPFQKAGKVHKVPEKIVETMPHFELTLKESDNKNYYLWSDAEGSGRAWNILQLVRLQHGKFGTDIWELTRKQHMGKNNYMILSTSYFKTLPEALYNAKIGHYAIGPNVLKNEDLVRWTKTGHF